MALRKSNASDDQIIAAYRAYSGSATRAAAEVGLARETVIAVLQRHGIDARRSRGGGKVVDMRPRQVTAMSQTVCEWAEGGRTTVTHGRGEAHAEQTLAALRRGRTPKAGFPRVEG